AFLDGDERRVAAGDAVLHCDRDDALLHALLPPPREPLGLEAAHALGGPQLLEERLGAGAIEIDGDAEVVPLAVELAAELDLADTAAARSQLHHPPVLVHHPRPRPPPHPPA